MPIKMHDQVTNAQYKEFCPDHKFKPGHENKPVVNVSYTDAVSYAKWLSQKTGRKFRLPTEAERIAAESTFEADFSNHPLLECPDVGTFGKNADGVTGLLGMTYDWCANPEDIEDPVALGWVTSPKKETSVSFQKALQVLDDLYLQRDQIDNKIIEIKKAIEVLQSL